ncbi:MAG: hypothetical protein KF865_03155 [Bdellovibrionaceae bacterium]|nr:hypothetical protein [Pseudobdellovibrionaceae bacterium]
MENAKEAKLGVLSLNSENSVPPKDRAYESVTHAHDDLFVVLDDTMVPQEHFYRQFVQNSRRLMDSYYHYFIATHIGNIAVDKDGASIAAQVRIVMGDENTFEAWYCEYRVLKQTESGIWWDRARTKVIKGRWHLRNLELVFEGLGVARGFCVRPMLPQLHISFDHDIISEGLKGRSLYAWLIESVGKEDRPYPTAPPSEENGGGFLKTFNFDSSPKNELVFMRGKVEDHRGETRAIFDVFLFEESKYAIVIKANTSHGPSMKFLGGLWQFDTDKKIFTLGTDATIRPGDSEEEWLFGVQYDMATRNQGTIFFRSFLYDAFAFSTQLDDGFKSKQKGAE